jgi:hypothetical protein
MTTLQSTLIGLFIPFLVAFSGKEEPFIVITNNSYDEVYIELWAFPDIDGEGRERVCAIHDMTLRDSTFLVVADSIELYHVSEISAVYEKESFDGFDIFVYTTKEKPVVQCGGTQKDTLYFQRHMMTDLLDNQPLEIEIKK